MNSSRMFAKAIKLYEAMAVTQITSTGENLRKALSVGGEVSLWDALAVFLVLYRLPLVFAPNNLSLKERSLARMRPYLGAIATLRDQIFTRSPITGCPSCEWSSSSRRPVILFLACTGRFYREVLLPVVENLRFRADVDVVSLDCSYGSVTAGDMQQLARHIDAKVLSREKEIRSQLRELRPALLSRDQLKLFLDNAECEGGDWLSLGDELGWLFNREFPRLIPLLAVSEHIMSRHRPDLIVTADDADQRSRVFSLTGKQAGIPTLVIQQGLSREDYPEWRLFSGTKIACMGEASRSILLDQGVPADAIAVTGHPGFDGLIKDAGEHAASVRKSLGLATGEKMVLFASQPYYVGAFRSNDVRREMISAVASATAIFPNTYLVIKPHPNEDERELRELCGKRPRLLFCDKTEDIAALIKACDVFVSMFSTSTVQALYAGKPVINVDFPNSGGASPFRESGATWVADSEESIAAHLRFLQDKRSDPEQRAAKAMAQRRFVEQMVYYPDGRAARRVVGLIEDILGLESSALKPAPRVQ